MSQAESEDLKRLAEVYGLREDEPFRWVPPPFLQQRTDYYRISHPSQAKSLPEGPRQMQFWWQNGSLRFGMIAFGQYRLHSLIEHFLNVYSQELEGEDALKNMEITGDLVINASLDHKLYPSMIVAIAAEVAATKVKLDFREVEHPAIVFKGTWNARNAGGSVVAAGGEPDRIEVYGANLNDPSIDFRDRTGGTEIFAKSIGSWIDKTVIIEASEAPENLRWRFRHVKIGTHEQARLSRDPQLVCMHIREQTGLQSHEEIRIVKRLFIERRP